MTLPEHADQNMLSPEDYADAVENRLDDMLEAGARLVAPAFTVAQEGQAEVIHEGKRYLITPNDTEFQEYTRVMTAEDAPRVANDLRFGDEHVVVGEIPRFARVVPQVVRSNYPANGTSPLVVFEKLGDRLGHMAANQDLVPNPERFSLRRNVLVLRDQLDVLLVPPFGFAQADETTQAALLERITDGFGHMHSHIGTLAMGRVLERGYDNGRSRI